jgi:hypothetical protein
LDSQHDGGGVQAGAGRPLPQDARREVRLARRQGDLGPIFVHFFRGKFPEPTNQARPVPQNPKPVV